MLIIFLLFEIIFLINPLLNVYYFEKTRDFYYLLCSITFRLMKIVTHDVNVIFPI